MKIKRVLATCSLSMLLLCAGAKEASSVDLCKQRINQLEKLIKKAKKLKFDTQREEGAIWMANTFLFYADWDEKNVEINKDIFGTWLAYSDNAAKMARELPEFERTEIVKMLDCSIEELTDVIEGDVVRRPAGVVDWNSIKFHGDRFISNGKPAFFNDYHFKTSTVNNAYTGESNGGSISLGSIDYKTGGISAEGQRLLDTDSGKSGDIMLGHSSIPKYLYEKDPDVAIGGRHFTAYDIDNPLIRESWDRVFDLIIPHVAGSSRVDLGYILSNEPHFFSQKDVWQTSAVSNYTIDKFKVWLKAKHKDIDRLNDLWQTNFASFDDVTIEIPFDAKIRTEPIGYDWMSFNQDRVTEWFQFLKDGIRRNDPEAIIHIKLIPRIFREDVRDHGMDFESLMNMCDILGNDAKIQGRLVTSKAPEEWEKLYAFNWYEVAIPYDFFESVSVGKTNINSESHYLSAGGWRDLYMTPERVRSSYWYATLQGMCGGTSWYWAREADGGPLMNLRGIGDMPDTAMGKAYPGSVAQQPRVANEVSKVYMDINAYADEVMGLTSTKRPARIFYSKVSAIKDLDYIATMLDLYTPLFFNGSQVGLATKGVIDGQDNSTWDVIMVRESEFVKVEEFEALQRYLDNGGTVILDSKSLKSNEYGEPLNMTLQSSNGELIHLDSVEDFVAKSDEILAAKGSTPTVLLEESNECGSKGCLWRSYAKDDKTTILCIVNIGRSEASLKLSSEKGISSIENLFTGADQSKSFNLKSQDVIMLEVRH